MVLVFYLSAAALYILLLPKPHIAKFILLFALIPIFACVKGRERVALRLRHPIASLFAGGILAFDFFLRQTVLGSDAQANWRRISTLAIPALITVLVLAASLPMIDALVSALLRRDGRGSSEPAVRERTAAGLGALFICAAIALLSSLQLCTVPFFKGATETDASVFLYIGRRMHEGFMPYRDIFDHKGPILYLINWLGLFLHTDWAPYLGVWLLELLNLFAFAYGAYLLLSEMTPPDSNM